MRDSNGPVADKKLFESFVFFGLDQAQEFATDDEAVIEQFADELDVFLPTGRQLAVCEIVHFEA